MELIDKNDGTFDIVVDGKLLGYVSAPTKLDAAIELLKVRDMPEVIEQLKKHYAGGLK